MSEKTNLINNARSTIGDGYVNLTMSNVYLSKDACTSMAKVILLNDYISGMTAEEIAMEIYAHAVCYYWYDPTGNFFQNNPISKTLHDKGADGIYLEDGGDSALRKAFYSLVWNNF